MRCQVLHQLGRWNLLLTWFKILHQYPKHLIVWPCLSSGRSRSNCRICWIKGLTGRVSRPNVLSSSSSGRRMAIYDCALTIKSLTRWLSRIDTWNCLTDWVEPPCFWRMIFDQVTISSKSERRMCKRQHLGQDMAIMSSLSCPLAWLMANVHESHELEVFGPYLDQFVIILIDDILIYSRFGEDHEMHFWIAMQTLREHRLYAKLSKYAFWLSKQVILVHVV